MLLDVSVSSKNVTATLHCRLRDGEKPVQYVGGPPLGAGAYDGIDDPH